MIASSVVYLLVFYNNRQDARNKDDQYDNTIKLITDQVQQKNINTRKYIKLSLFKPLHFNLSWNKYKKRGNFHIACGLRPI